jgi:GntR family transcriptional regulator
MIGIAEVKSYMSDTDSQTHSTEQEASRVGIAGQESGQKAKASSVGSRHIADWLRERIESEDLLPGDRMPTARELTETFGVTVTTARRALEVLTYEGLVDTQHSYLRVRPFRPFRRVVSARHHSSPSIWRTYGADRLTTRHLRTSEEPVPSPVARVLRIPTSSLVSVRQSVTELYGRPVHLTTTYRPVGLIIDTVHSWLTVREELRLRMPNTTERERLDLPPGVPIAEITKTFYDQRTGTRPVELSTLIIDGNCCILEYDYVIKAGDYKPS